MSGWGLLFAASGEAIRTYPLDERIVYSIRVTREEPTTCLFPGALTALESANLSTKAEDAPPTRVQLGGHWLPIGSTGDPARLLGFCRRPRA